MGLLDLLKEIEWFAQSSCAITSDGIAEGVQWLGAKLLALEK